ncbi:MAG: zinc dependent phospholipase C family protein [Cyclobacteriaceae bacterium]|nr:zinc dependent phospholipase C family protein [Cyclobacteriaceae bacterium]
MTTPLKALFVAVCAMTALDCAWGFYAHKQINRLAVFTLPPEMVGFYKKNIGYITEAAVNPDRRRYVVDGEAARHYIDLDHFGDSALAKLSVPWDVVLTQYSEDTLLAHGVVPWHIVRTYHRLREAFLVGDPDRILRLSADLGHYVGDAHVPLHTTVNYDGQRTGQTGIHAFWESRLPELFSTRYNYLVGRATYVPDPQRAAWAAVASAHHALDSVLRFERILAAEMGDRRYSYETKGRQTLRVYSQEYAEAYHTMLSGMVERQMRAAIRLTGSLWYTAWVDAGQPDLMSLMAYAPSADELRRRREELKRWREAGMKADSVLHR